MAFWLILVPFPLLQNCSDPTQVSVLVPLTQVTLQWVPRSLLEGVEKAS